MTTAPPLPPKPAPAPDAFRDALAELVQVGLCVARMVARVAEAETALAAAAVRAAEAEGDLALPTSLAEAIEADRATAAAATAQETMVPRTEAVARAFRVVSRAIRMTVLLAERLDRGWARHGARDDRHAMARRQIVRAVADAIAQDSDGPRAERLTEMASERIEALDVEAAIGDRPAEDIIAEICRDLGLDTVRVALRSPAQDTAGLAEEGAAALLAGKANGWKRRPPDG